MNKQDLIKAVADQLGLENNHTTTGVDAVFSVITSALQCGEDVRISGFGVFKRVETKARTGRNPATGEAIAIAAGHRAKFRPSSKLLGA